MKTLVYIFKLGMMVFVYPHKVVDSVNRAQDSADFDVILFGGR